MEIVANERKSKKKKPSKGESDEFNWKVDSHAAVLNLRNKRQSNPA